MPPRLCRWPMRALVMLCDPPCGNWPSNLVRRGAQHQCDGRAQRVVEAEKRVCGQPGKQGPRARLREVMHRNAPGRLKRRHAEARHEQRMPWNAHNRPERLLRKPVPMINQRRRPDFAMPAHPVRIPCPGRRDRAPASRQFHRREDAPAAPRRVSSQVHARPAVAS